MCSSFLCHTFLKVFVRPVCVHSPRALQVLAACIMCSDDMKDECLHASGLLCCRYQTKESDHCIVLYCTYIVRERLKVHNWTM